jgi:hypothetical protein
MEKPMTAPELEALFERLKRLKLDDKGQIVAIDEDWCPPVRTLGLEGDKKLRKKFEKQEELLKKLLKSLKAQ